MTADPKFDEYIHQPIPAQFYDRFVPMLSAGLDDGAIGIGSGTEYAPGITRPEMLDLTQLAGRKHVCVFTHIRYGSLIEPNSTLEALQEQIVRLRESGDTEPQTGEYQLDRTASPDVDTNVPSELVGA